MNDNAKAWVEALESGEYKQGKAALRDAFAPNEDLFCCLGVACELAVKAGVIPPPRSVNGVPWCYGDPDKEATSRNYLPQSVQEWLGLATCQGGFPGHLPIPGLDKWAVSLAQANDEGASFKEIADVIKSEPIGLFI